MIIASGLLWFAVYNVTLNEAERNLDAGTAAMLVNTGPIFIALFAGLFLGEGFPQRLLLGLAVAFGGTAVIAFASSAAPAGGGNPTLGIVLCLVAALAYAAGVTLQKPALRAMPALNGHLAGVRHRDGRLPAVRARARRASWARRRSRASAGSSTSACSRRRSRSRRGRSR